MIAACMRLRCRFTRDAAMRRYAADDLMLDAAAMMIDA